ncbi:hypothetical protein [Microbacterium caowuchunii]|uniref:hypothetical protein n=1 Tax=Microbacterium caowuchunii TaxID=2614638 RepID=UPI001783A24A|nr:hypothetical protein [Microbacterium caowuchunii]
MPDPCVFEQPADRWLAEFLARSAALYRSSPEYRGQLLNERAPMFARNYQPHLAA